MNIQRIQSLCHWIRRNKNSRALSHRLQSKLGRKFNGIFVHCDHYQSVFASAGRRRYLQQCPLRNAFEIARSGAAA